MLFQGDTTLVIATGDYRIERADGLSIYAAGFATFGQFEGESTFNLAGVGQVGKVLDNGYEPFGASACSCSTMTCRRSPMTSPSS